MLSSVKSIKPILRLEFPFWPSKLEQEAISVKPRLQQNSRCIAEVDFVIPQNVSFKPNWTWRGPPDPSTGLPPSGVVVP